MSRLGVMHHFNIPTAMSDQGSIMDNLDNLSFDDFDPSQGSLDFFDNFGGVDRMEAASPGQGSREDDVYAQLEQKEKDLILAAELGKALLERNEELVKRQDQMQQELAEKMEELEQQKHHLRRRIENVQGEYESKLLDLQSELSSMHKELSNQKASQRAMEKEKQSVVDELSEQNQRLVHQIKQASDVEEELNEHIQRLRDQVHLRRQHSQHREDPQVEELQKEMQRLSAKRGELERKLHTTSAERDTMAASLKETNDRCLMLDKHSRELDQQLGLRDAEVSKLRQLHNDTAEELEELRYHSTLNSSANAADFLGNSLHSELGLEMGVAGQGDPNEEHGLQGAAAAVNYEDEDIECDDVDTGFVEEEKRAGVTEMKECGTSPFRESNAAGDKTCQDEVCHMEHQQLQDVLNEVQSTLSELVRELKAFQATPNPIGSPQRYQRTLANRKGSQEIVRVGAAHPKEVLCLLRDLRSVTRHITRNLELDGESVFDTSSETDIDKLENHIEALRGELCSTQSHIELLQAEVDRQDEELKRKDSELCTLTAKVRSLEHELRRASSSSLDDLATCDDISVMSSEGDREDSGSSLSIFDPRRRSLDPLHDISSDVSQDEIIERLQSERDEAIQRRTAAEEELTQAKTDMSKLDDQLIGAIKQKVSLSQQLDEWQIDIHQLLDQHLKKQLTRQEGRKAGSKKSKASPQKRFPFWS
ncbi:BICD family-like cargo adapter 2 isoform X2 [Asterias rubens]|uniref:BICD family-like cargo adapter 2 isoform X2 n=1 Tax=Asterias rubens TaxID=7604 RepID=UPI001455C17E|nr:BICD family-like cargo adapter 2 isoform X2 [Asterias rubens]